MKRILIVLATVLTLTGCVRWNGSVNVSVPAETEKATESESAVPSETEDTQPVEYDMGGATVIIAADDPSLLTSDGSYPSDRAIAARNEELEKSHNCKLAISNRTAEQIYSELAAAGGGYYADIISLPLSWYGRFADDGLLRPISDFSTIDPSAPYFNDDTDLYQKGKTYALRSGASPWADGVYCLFFSTRLASNKGLDLYKTASDGALTWDYIISVCDPATDGGIALPDSVTLSRCVFKSCGLSFTGYSDGIRSCDYIGEGSEYTVSVIKTLENDLANVGEDPLAAFYGGESLFYIAPLSTAAAIADMPDAFGVLPLPKKSADGSYVGYTDLSAQVLCIPVGAGDNAAVIYSALAKASRSTVTEAYITDLAAFCLRDNTSALNAENIIAGAKSDYAYIFGYSDLVANATSWAFEHTLENGGNISNLYSQYVGDLLDFANVK